MIVVICSISISGIRPTCLTISLSLYSKMYASACVSFVCLIAVRWFQKMTTQVPCLPLCCFKLLSLDADVCFGYFIYSVT
jgi:hypothetical protein